MNIFFTSLVLISATLSSFNLRTSTMPPSLPSSSYTFAQIAQPSNSNQNVNYANLPCFKAYTTLQTKLNYPANTGGLVNQLPNSSATPLITQLQTAFSSSTLTAAQLQQFVTQANTQFATWQTNLIAAASSYNPTSFNN